MHPSNRITLDNLKDVIFWHRPSPEQIMRMEEIAVRCATAMQTILEKCPECADRTKALQYIRAARMWANSAIALEPPSEIDHERETPMPMGDKIPEEHKQEGPALCEMCGKPLPPGEENFRYHGFSGGCPE